MAGCGGFGGGSILGRTWRADVFAGAALTDFPIKGRGFETILYHPPTSKVNVCPRPLPTLPPPPGANRMGIMPKTIDVTGLPEPLVMAIESMVNTYREKSREGGEGEERPLGWLAGRWTVPDSFFEPLPKDVLDAFNGGEERE